MNKLADLKGEDARTRAKQYLDDPAGKPEAVKDLNKLLFNYLGIANKLGFKKGVLTWWVQPRPQGARELAPEAREKVKAGLSTVLVEGLGKKVGDKAALLAPAALTELKEELKQDRWLRLWQPARDLKDLDPDLAQFMLEMYLEEKADEDPVKSLQELLNKVTITKPTFKDGLPTWSYQAQDRKPLPAQEKKDLEVGLQEILVKALCEQYRGGVLETEASGMLKAELEKGGRIQERQGPPEDGSHPGLEQLGQQVRQLSEDNQALRKRIAAIDEGVKGLVREVNSLEETSSKFGGENKRIKRSIKALQQQINRLGGTATGRGGSWYYSPCLGYWTVSPSAASPSRPASGGRGYAARRAATPNQTGAAPARLTVRLPRNARLYVDRVLCPLTSSVRSFNTPRLQPGREYSYSLRAEVVRRGKIKAETRRVKVQAGKHVSVSFVDLGKPANVAHR